MHIAVLVYGRLKNCDIHYDNIMKTLGLGDHTFDFIMSSDNSPMEQLREFVYLYKPILYNNSSIEYDIDISKYPRRYETNIDGMIRHFINKYRLCQMLKQHVESSGIKYDAVITIRIDLVFNTPLDFTKIEEDTIYIPKGQDHYGINDQFAYGSTETMLKYNNLYSNINILLENGSIAHPETLTLFNIIGYGLSVIRIPIEYRISKD